MNILERTGSTSEDDADDLTAAAVVDDQLTVAVVAEATGGSWAIVSAHGEVDVATAPSLREALDGVSGPGARVILDLSGVSFMDSTGLSVLISAYKQLTESGGELRTVIAAARIRTLLEITKLDKIFPLFPTVAAAQESPAASAN